MKYYLIVGASIGIGSAISHRWQLNPICAGLFCGGIAALLNLMFGDC